MLPKGSFLVFGPTAQPSVHILTEEAMVQYFERRRLVELRESAKMLRDCMRVTFGQPDATYALPAWSHDAMMAVASDYTGPFQVELRGIAAAIVLGKPFTKDNPPGKAVDDSAGGEKVPRKPAPKDKGPSALQTLMGAASP